MTGLSELNYSDDDFISVMTSELPQIQAMTHEIAQQEANTDFITEQQNIRMGNNDDFSNYRY